MKIPLPLGVELEEIHRFRLRGTERTVSYVVKWPGDPAETGIIVGGFVLLNSENEVIAASNASRAHRLAIELTAQIPSREPAPDELKNISDILLELALHHLAMFPTVTPWPSRSAATSAAVKLGAGAGARSCPRAGVDVSGEGA